jgi:hypothetical protein
VAAPPVAPTPAAVSKPEPEPLAEGPAAKKLCLQYLREQETVLAIRACKKARELGETVPEVARRQ